MYNVEKFNPLVDFAFKKLFGVDENKDILMDLINAVVSEDDKVENIEIKNPYNPKLFKNDKLSILDIKAQCIKNKQWYNIEVQIMNQDCYGARALYYWSKLYNSQLTAGINYDNLYKTISINFLNFNCLANEDYYHNVYKLTNVVTKNKYSPDHLEIHFVELKKYHETFSNTLDKWANFLVKAHKYDTENLPKELQIPSIQKAVEVLERMHFTPEERDNYEAGLKWFRDEEMAIKTATNKGREIGMTEGKEIGMTEGKEIGFMDAKLKIALKMKQNGISTALISETTGLSSNEINQLS